MSKKIFTQRYYYLNLLLGVVALVLIGWLTIKWLENYTRHDEQIEIPDFVGKHLDSLLEYVEMHQMKYVVMDSVFDDEKPKGSIVLQNPLPHAHIKTGRTIYVSIVSQAPEMSTVPNLINLSVRQGVNLLKNSNLTIESIQFIEGFDRNSIQEVLLDGTPVMAGTKVFKQSKLTIVASSGMKGRNELIPNLIGKKLPDAIDVIYTNSFNLGEMKYKEEIPNAQFYVYYQFPKAQSAMPLGTTIHLKFTTQLSEIEELNKEAKALYDTTYNNQYQRYLDSISAEYQELLESDINFEALDEPEETDKYYEL